MIYTVNSLLAELGQELPMGNGEKYRRVVGRACRRFHYKVGYAFTAKEDTLPFEVRAGVVTMEDYMVDVLDAGLSKKVMSGYKLDGGERTNHPLAFRIDVDEVNFPNKESGIVWLKLQKLPTNEQLELVIKEELYDGCLELAKAKVLEQLYTHPRHREYPQLEQKAMVMADEVRAFLNARGGEAKNRSIRKYLR